MRTLFSISQSHNNDNKVNNYTHVLCTRWLHLTVCMGHVILAPFVQYVFVRIVLCIVVIMVLHINPLWLDTLSH